ncbi:hypothetical protein ABT160_28550 [Streptomyces sp. NPDC001941]|uniref:hypothetical protein n=1 Tax=Streptomyces sp. NPDC001941 TaxID=3154659 RepID=UPI0033333EC6
MTGLLTDVPVHALHLPRPWQEDLWIPRFTACQITPHQPLETALAVHRHHLARWQLLAPHAQDGLAGRIEQAFAAMLDLAFPDGHLTACWSSLSFHPIPADRPGKFLWCALVLPSAPARTVLPPRHERLSAITECCHWTSRGAPHGSVLRALVRTDRGTPSRPAADNCPAQQPDAHQRSVPTATPAARPLPIVRKDHRS